MTRPRAKQEASPRALAFGEVLRKLRRKHSYTLKALAERIPMSPSNLSRIELGKQGPPSDEAIEQIARALDADPAELLRAAGRTAGGESFEQVVLERLDAIGQDVREVKDAVATKKSTTE
jgi:transcriptional regulator with XRE-family HTH domain